MVHFNGKSMFSFIRNLFRDNKGIRLPSNCEIISGIKSKYYTVQCPDGKAREVHDKIIALNKGKRIAVDIIKDTDKSYDYLQVRIYESLY